MSATDSDNSIDWLASDNEDNECDREFDCTGEHSQSDAPPSLSSPPHLGPSMGSQVREASSQGSPQGCKGARDSAIGQYKTHKGGKANNKQAPKRRHSSAEEGRKERKLNSNVSERKRLFSSKCMELQCYIHPLSLILDGLRSGRYRERLSSFQESVAMDRIQRIMGVLQNPCMGEKYINIILKMEEMLKSWFPNVKLQDQVTVTPTEEAVPVKKPKLSPLTTTAAVSPVTVSESSAGGPKALRVTDLTPPAAYSASNLKWLHTSPICSHTAEQAQAGPRYLLAPTHRDLTQDNAVSSSTDSDTKTKDSLPRGKINAPCLERLLKSTESIITRKGTGALMDSSWS